MRRKGAILIISGPSGCGKSTLLKNVYKEITDYYFSISTTTREPRIGEKDGVDYLFTSKDEFKQDIQMGEFLEWAEVHGNYYGTSLKPIKQALNEGKLVIFDIDVQGHEIVRKKLGDLLTSVFITTPSLKILKDRLMRRNTDSIETIEKRIQNAAYEIKSFQKYDYFIVNDDLEKASKELISIARSARVKSKTYERDTLLSDWLNS